MSLKQRAQYFLELATISVAVDKKFGDIKIKTRKDVDKVLNDSWKALHSNPRFRELMKLGKKLKLQHFQNPIEFKNMDNEALHMQEDDLKDEFISMLAKNKLPTSDIIEISQILHEITQIGYTRWYA